MRNFLQIVFLTSVIGCHAQSNQLMSRLGMNGKFKLSKNLSLNTGIQMRLNNSFRSYSSTNFSLEGTYKFSKSVKMGLNYRNLIQPNANILVNQKRNSFRNRVQIQLEATPSEWLNWDKLIEMDFRTVFQYEQFMFKRNQLTWRNKLTIKPILKKSSLNPYVSAEVFYRFNQFAYFVDDELITQGMMNEIRYSIGTEVKLSKNDAIDIGCLIRDYQQPKPTNLVFMLTYIHDFGRILQKD